MSNTMLLKDQALVMYMEECTLRVKRHSHNVETAATRLCQAGHLLLKRNVEKGAARFEALVTKHLQVAV